MDLANTSQSIAVKLTVVCCSVVNLDTYCIRMDPHWVGCPESGSVLGMRIKSRSIEIYQNSSKTDVNVPTVSTVINEKPKKNKSYFFGFLKAFRKEQEPDP